MKNGNYSATLFSLAFVLSAARYGEQLAEVMKNMVLLGEVANLAKDVERFSGEYANNVSALPNVSDSAITMQDMWTDEGREREDSDRSHKNTQTAVEAAKSFIEKRNSANNETDSRVSQSSARGMGNEEFSHSQQLQLAELLDAWEEPETADQKEASRDLSWFVAGVNICYLTQCKSTGEKNQHRLGFAI